MGLTKKEILKAMAEHDVRFLRLQFTDILGKNKNVEVPASQFEKALDGEMMFDGSSIEGFTRNVTYPDGTPFEGDPRGVLKRQIERLKKLGFD